MLRKLIRRFFHLIVLFVLLSIGIISYNRKESPDCWCFDEEHTIERSDILPELESPAHIRQPAIFFIESSCTSREAGKVVLNSRQACAVESAARMNPESHIYVLFVSWAAVNFSENSRTDKIVQSLQQYRNIYLRHIRLLSYTLNTPVEDLYRSRTIHHSTYAKSHMSDLLRYLTLWKYGGTYLDLDVVVISRLENLKPNYAGAESETAVAAGVINFDQFGFGHKLATICLNDFHDNYQGSDWGTNGPGVITRLSKKICTTEKISEMRPEICQNFTVYPPSSFYALKWDKWRQFFTEENSTETLRILEKSKVIHVWNQLTSAVNVTIGSRQPYGLIAQKYCPNVYNSSGKYFY